MHQPRIVLGEIPLFMFPCLAFCATTRIGISFINCAPAVRRGYVPFAPQPSLSLRRPPTAAKMLPRTSQGFISLAPSAYRYIRRGSTRDAELDV
ncbi:uncharacterized protein EI90DRAFT_3066499, partial [Cantharellus anzutake]|uniref:uncharacterized protein n=1 Tax=Cantharellus anzutake TaxID=1750568 RepID=UPI00190840E2